MDTEAVRVPSARFAPASRSRSEARSEARSEGLDSEARENAKADSILHSVFPPSVAKALKEGRKVCLL